MKLKTRLIKDLPITKSKIRSIRLSNKQNQLIYNRRDNKAIFGSVRSVYMFNDGSINGKIKIDGTIKPVSFDDSLKAWCY